MQDYQKFAYSSLNNLLPSPPPPPQQLWHMINYAWKEKNMLRDLSEISRGEGGWEF